MDGFRKCSTTLQQTMLKKQDYVRKGYGHAVLSKCYLKKYMIHNNLAVTPVKEIRDLEASFESDII